MIFWEQEENGKHFSKLRGKKSTVSLFAAFVETPHTSHLRDMKVNERLYFALRVVAGICNVNNYGRLSGNCRDKGQWRWQTHHCMCLNMQYQPNLPVETFTPQKHQSGTIRNPPIVLQAPELSWRESEMETCAGIVLGGWEVGGGWRSSPCPIHIKMAMLSFQGGITEHTKTWSASDSASFVWNLDIFLFTKRGTELSLVYITAMKDDRVFLCSKLN